MRKLIILLILIASFIFIGYTSLGLVGYYSNASLPRAASIPPPPPEHLFEKANRSPQSTAIAGAPGAVLAHVPPRSISFDVFGLKIGINEQTPWESIFKLMFAVLGTYVGIRLTNKYVK